MDRKEQIYLLLQNRTNKSALPVSEIQQLVGGDAATVAAACSELYDEGKILSAGKLTRSGRPIVYKITPEYYGKEETP